MSANGVSLKGVILIDLGPCGYSGTTKTKDGKKLPKSDLVFRKFRMEDPKVFKDLGLPKTLSEFTFCKQSIKTFLTIQDEENE